VPRKSRAFLRRFTRRPAHVVRLGIKQKKAPIRRIFCGVKSPTRTPVRSRFIDTGTPVVVTRYRFYTKRTLAALWNCAITEYSRAFFVPFSLVKRASFDGEPHQVGIARSSPRAENNNTFEFRSLRAFRTRLRISASPAVLRHRCTASTTRTQICREKSGRYYWRSERDSLVSIYINIYILRRFNEYFAYRVSLFFVTCADRTCHKPTDSVLFVEKKQNDLVLYRQSSRRFRFIVDIFRQRWKSNVQI